MILRPFDEHAGVFVVGLDAQTVEVVEHRVRPDLAMHLALLGGRKLRTRPVRFFVSPLAYVDSPLLLLPPRLAVGHALTVAGCAESLRDHFFARRAQRLRREAPARVRVAS